MAISIDQIKELRERTGVSMMACKKALEEANGDEDVAIDILRKKGEAKAEDRADRVAGQGVVAIKSEGGKTAMVTLLCETDFASRGEDFIALADNIVAKLLKGEISVNDKDIPEVKDFGLKSGEKIEIGGMELMEGGNVGSYVHSNKKIGVLVSLEGGSEDLAKDIAMHVAAMNPQFISPEEVLPELVNKEKEIWAEQLKNEGKPAEIVEKIMFGKEKKFREENALLKQTFVKDSEKIIEQLLQAEKATLKAFKRFAI
ncbi:MAG: translation elongation factor Ts [Candidatus Peregrinibacteria bacterium]|nr:translation elongation factor Ts [Candidatus Peregrinibacteria bacterium]